jgi:hypothetical protein
VSNQLTDGGRGSILGETTDRRVLEISPFSREFVGDGIFDPAC